EELYVQKEIEFPVQVGMAKFMAERDQSGVARYDREGLHRWARERFKDEAHRFSEEGFRTHSKAQLREVLLEASKAGFPTSGQKQMEEAIARQFAAAPLLDDENAGELAAWANSALRLNVEPSSLNGLGRDDVRQVLYNAFDDRYRPEMRAM